MWETNVKKNSKRHFLSRRANKNEKKNEWVGPILNKNKKKNIEKISNMCWFEVELTKKFFLFDRSDIPDTSCHEFHTFQPNLFNLHTQWQIWHRADEISYNTNIFLVHELFKFVYFVQLSANAGSRTNEKAKSGANNHELRLTLLTGISLFQKQKMCSKQMDSLTIKQLIAILSRT